MGLGENAGEFLYDLDPVYDCYVQHVNEHAKTSNLMVVSLDVKLRSGQITRFDKYHVKDLPSNREALGLFVIDVAGLLQKIRSMEKAQQKIRQFRSVACLPGLAIRCVQLAHCPRQPLEDPALLCFSSKRALFERSDVTHCCTQPVFSCQDEKICQEVLCSKLLSGRSWSLWLDGFFNILPTDNVSSGPLLMRSEEEAVNPVSYNALPLLLRKELFKFDGTLAASWMFQSVAGYDVWL